MLRSNEVRRSTRPMIHPRDNRRTDGREDDRIAELLALLALASPHVLLIGDDKDLALVFQRMQPYLPAVVVPWVPDLTSDVPAGPLGTLVVKDVSHLDAEQQACLAKIAAAPDVQIISMASAPLFPLIDKGVFLDELYYRLNMVTLDLTMHDGGLSGRKED
jgi:hypothetical protein